jgi:cation diffusion facilitator family transporter
MAGGSSKVVYAALVGNVLVAATKFAAAAVSGSSAMFTEAIHSSTDCTNQVLLLIGDRRGKRPRDESHPFGYGMEIYFWTFVVAMLVLLAGGAYSIYQGLEQLDAPHPIQSPTFNLLVLLVSALFEGGSFVVGYRQYKKVAGAHRLPGVSVSLIRFISWSKDPGLFETLLEDSAALAGIAIAAIGTVANAYFGYLRADGIASLAIGALLIANGIAILVATQSLVAGEAAAPTVLHDLQLGLRGEPWSERISGISTLHLGPDCILVAVALRAHHGALSDRDLGQEIERRLKEIDPRILEVLFRFEGAGDQGPPLAGRMEGDATL